MAAAHGAGPMLVPLMLGLCVTAPAVEAISDVGHATVMNFRAQSNVATAIAVAAVHTLAMMLAGLTMAWAVYRYLGMPFLRRFWLESDLV